MPYLSPFSTRRGKQPVPASKAGAPISRLDFRGLDLTSPYDVVANNHSPYARNFRMYAEEPDSRKVAISSRKGSGPYTVPIGQAQDQANTSTTGAADQEIGIESWKAMKFTAAVTGPLTKIELRLKSISTSSGPIRIAIYSDRSGAPGDKLAESGILNSAITSSYAYIPASFIEAPTVTSGQVYWIIAWLQDDGTGVYHWSSNTASALALTSASSGNSWTATTYSLNFRTYVSSTDKVKGIARYAPSNGINKTVVAIGTSVYQVDDNTGILSAILTGQSANATDYHFDYADNKLFWVNGYSDLATWDGTTSTTNSELTTNGTFETNVTGWTGGTGTTVSRTTAAGEFRTGVAAMKLVGSGGNHAVSTFAYTYEKGKQYTLTMYVKGTAGQQVSPRAQGVLGTAVTLTGGWDLLTYTFTATASTVSAYGVESSTANATIFVDDVSLKFTGIQFIIHSQLPILKLLKIHKNRLFGISASDPNKMIWSEEPGNDDGSGNLWYKAYLSTGFAYVPVSKASDPISALVKFQDNLFIFTRSSKHVLYGSDPGTFIIREAMGKKGAVSQNATYADENFIYFAAPDGLYRFGGAKDEIISENVQTEFESMADVDKTFITKWKRQVRFYYPASGSPVNNRCLIWHTVFEEMMLDTDAYVSHALQWTDGNDPNNLVEASSTAPVLHYAEQDYNNLGKAIDFEYHCKADSGGIPAMRKRIVKFFPLLQGENGSYSAQVAVDKDLEDNPRWHDYPLSTGGPKIGTFKIGDGTKIADIVQFQPKRFRISGYGYYWQPRIKREAINNQIRFIGYVLSFRTKRL